MKDMYFKFVSLTLSLLANISSAATVVPLVVQASATTSFGDENNIIDRGVDFNEFGAGNTYTSGDDFAIVAALQSMNYDSTTYYGSSGSDAIISFDFGSVLNITSVAIWTPDLNPTSVTVYADTDSDFTNGGTTQLGTFTGLSQGLLDPADTIVFDTMSRYVHFDVDSAGSTWIINEAAFNVGPIPEPSTSALSLIGTMYLLLKRKRN